MYWPDQCNAHGNNLPKGPAVCWSNVLRIPVLRGEAVPESAERSGKKAQVPLLKCLQCLHPLRSSGSKVRLRPGPLTEASASPCKQISPSEQVGSGASQHTAGQPLTSGCQTPHSAWKLSTPLLRQSFSRSSQLEIPHRHPSTPQIMSRHALYICWS